jgi:hypothetical protein
VLQVQAGPVEFWKALHCERPVKSARLRDAVITFGAAHSARGSAAWLREVLGGSVKKGRTATLR